MNRSRKLILLGGGHAHALALLMLAQEPPPNTEITLLSLSRYTPYSGMLPGLIAGHYNFSDCHIDLARLCSKTSAKFIECEAIGVDIARQQVLVRDAKPISFDLLSIDTGASPELGNTPGAGEHCIAVKPVHSFLARFERFISTLDKPVRVAVVGGGAGGIEISLALKHHLQQRCESLSLVNAGKQLLPEYHCLSRKAVQSALDKADIRTLNHTRVSEIDHHTLHFADGNMRHANAVFWCTGVSAPRWLANTQFTRARDGFLALNDNLQVLGQDNVFAAGDVGTQVKNPHPKAGVFAVRQAPVLAENLKNYLQGKPLQPYHPQRRFLSLISLGERKAVADRGLFLGSGASVWRIKDAIDRQFMGRFA